MRLENLIELTARKKKRVGRGVGSGKGKTAGRGTKGQKSRSGYKIPRRFEGGQTALIARLPKKRGFKSHQIAPAVVNLATIEKKYRSGEKVTPKTLLEKKILKEIPKSGVKILGVGKLTKKLIFRDLKLSKSVLKQVQKEITSRTPKPKKPKKAKVLKKKSSPKKVSREARSRFAGKK